MLLDAVEIQSFNDSQDTFEAVVTVANDTVIHIDFYKKYEMTKIPVWVHATLNTEEHERISTKDRYRNVFAGCVDQGKSNDESLERAAYRFFREAIKSPYIADELNKDPRWIARLEDHKVRR